MNSICYVVTICYCSLYNMNKISVQDFVALMDECVALIQGPCFIF